MTDCQLRIEDGALHLQGVLDKNNVNDVYLRSKELLQQGALPERIDLQRIEHIDSAGLALLLEWQSWANKADHRLRLEHAPQQLLMLARLSELDRILHLERSN